MKQILRFSLTDWLQQTSIAETKLKGTLSQQDMHILLYRRYIRSLQLNRNKIYVDEWSRSGGGRQTRSGMVMQRMYLLLPHHAGKSNLA